MRRSAYWSGDQFDNLAQKIGARSGLRVMLPFLNPCKTIFPNEADKASMELGSKKS